MIVLASASPRRRELLETLRIDFEVDPSGAEERVLDGESPVETAVRLASLKAVDVASRRDGWVLGADTVVVVEGEALGKPDDDAHALAMLRRLAGGWHAVVTAVALARSAALVEAMSVETRVHALPQDDASLLRYVATGEGRDKAGAYGIQGIAAGFVDRIEGSWSNVVGLPSAETVALLRRHGAIEAWP
ncbi:MAG: nucleoside triphosphate pyrophosphatase [Sandaracinaceae bacterium]